MTKLEVHPATDVSLSKHASTPSGPVNIHRYRIGAEDRVSGNPCFTVALTDDSVNVVSGLNFEHCARCKTAQIDATLDFGPNNVAVDRVAKIRMRFEERQTIRFGSHL